MPLPHQPRRPAFFAALAMVLALALVATMAGTASAQQRTERKSILQLLFGGGGGNASTPEPEPTRPARTSRPKTVTRSAVQAAAPAPEVTKLENARKILVMGDFLANGVAEGLTTGFAESPGVVVIDRSNGSSGLVRDDYYDWPAEAAGIISDVAPAVIVMQLGSNDRQQMLVNGTREAVRSANWLAEYQRRLDGLLATLAAPKIPVLWVGLPAFKSSSMTADMVALNAIYRSRVERVGGEFIDIWDGFVDEDGKFVFTGSDINGQQVRLRGSDGINLTKAGRRKVAFYVEKSVRRLLGDAADADIATLGEDNLPELNFPSAPAESVNILRTVPVSMTDPDLDGGGELLGGSTTQAAFIPSPRDLLVEKGEIAPAPEGRADDFSWPRKPATAVK
ncbi:hypothetical protein DFR52_107132 [Hoeflea marina]|uniref:SGNH hydrolase-type esterase domain-containing protein n=1 Tax=Hoeflea marina TaxID=274592 RepID=A0A317PE76_9HYPH|nr:DUF459 domain-containing protein [Hoeflea marina]PWV97218.1 hypothetical protein DFR52_107132 [Hoeflea marina]